MSVSSYDAVAEKVLIDLDLAISKNPNINEFYIIPTLEEENKNSSPIVKGENTLGLESWIVTHIYPYAHHQILQKNNYKNQNFNKLLPCLTGVALLNPEMSTVWNRRKELIISKKLNIDNELRLTTMALSRKPKCSEALNHRKWVIQQTFNDVQNKYSLLVEELRLSEMIANRYHSNYHAWSHRMWSLQHLFPDSLCLSSKKNSLKNGLYDMISESSELFNRVISRNEYSYLKNCETSHIYFEELENNFKWISSHVSDHSGLHFRKFLITEIFSYMKNYLNVSNKMEYETDIDYPYINTQNNLVSLVFTNGKINVKDFISSFDYGNHYSKAINEYLQNLEQEVTFFDLVLSLIVTELKSNHSLCLIFSGHEALWYYRRFLVFIYKQLIEALDFFKSNTRHKTFLHQDSNGVPHRKDFKFDDLENSDIDSAHSNLYLALHKRLLNNEEEIISKTNCQEEHVKCILKNYSNWLKYCFKE